MLPLISLCSAVVQKWTWCKQIILKKGQEHFQPGYKGNFQSPRGNVETTQQKFQDDKMFPSFPSAPHPINISFGFDLIRANCPERGGKVNKFDLMMSVDNLMICVDIFDECGHI